RHPSPCDRSGYCHGKHRWRTQVGGCPDHVRAECCLPPRTNPAHLVQAGPSPLRGEIRACPVAWPARRTLRVSLLRRARRIPWRTVDTPVPPLYDHWIATVSQITFSPCCDGRGTPLRCHPK